MSSDLNPRSDTAVVQMAEYQRVARFGYELLMREHLLNVEALAEYWLLGWLPWMNLTAFAPAIDDLSDPE